MVEPSEKQNNVVKTVEGLQWLRELMAVLISTVILILSAVTMWLTFLAAGITADPRISGAADVEKAKQYQIDAYNRQKDIMLYALALFGTVTGYYLGRVPAEANAKRAENAADSAQKQLSKTQEQLSSTAASASEAAAHLGHAKEEKAKVTASLKDSTKALRDVRATLAEVGGDGDFQGRATLAGPADAAAPQSEKLKQARDRIDTVLAHIESQILS
jgi:hypothetical protein